MAHTYIHTYIHTHTNTYVHTRIHTSIHTHIHTYIYTNVYIYTHIHTYIHSYIHTYIHTHTRILFTYVAQHNPHCQRSDASFLYACWQIYWVQSCNTKANRTQYSLKILNAPINTHLPNYFPFPQSGKGVLLNCDGVGAGWHQIVRLSLYRNIWNEGIRFGHWTERLVLGSNQLILLIYGRYCAQVGRNAIFVLTLEIFFGIRNIAIQVSHFRAVVRWGRM
jgi:hypothetical protein